MTAISARQPLPIGTATRRASRQEVSGRTARFEQLLLSLLVVGLALEESLPRVGPVSVGFILFAAVGIYVFVRYQRAFQKVLTLPLPLAFLALVFISLVSEFGRSEPMFHYARRIGLMALGMVVVATLVRTRAAIRSALLAFLIVASLQAIIVIVASGQALYSSTAVDYFTATSARIAALKDVPLEGNFNRIAFIIGTGGILGLIAAGQIHGTRMQWMVRFLSVLCFVGVAFFASRSAMVTTFAAGAALVVLRRKRRARSVVVAAFLLLFLWFAMPAVTRARFSFGEVSARGREDGRTKVYRKTLENIPEVLPFGVGEARYWGEWALDVLQHRLGTHSAPLQFVVTWGLPGVVALALVMLAVIGSLPRIRADDPLRIGMWAIAAAVLLRWLASHTVYDKEFSILLGIIAGAQAMVWPRLQVDRSVAPGPTPAPALPGRAGAVALARPGWSARHRGRGGQRPANAR